MDILSDVSINGSLTVNKGLNVKGVSTYSNYLAVNSAVFANGGFGFTTGSVDITRNVFAYKCSCLATVFTTNIYVCGIIYGDGNSVCGIVNPCDISQTKYLNLNVPSGCQKFFISETKGTYLPSITILDNDTWKEVKMDLYVEPMCVDGRNFFCVSASRTSTNSGNYKITVIE